MVIRRTHGVNHSDSVDHDRMESFFTQPSGDESTRRGSLPLPSDALGSSEQVVRDHSQHRNSATRSDTALDRGEFKIIPVDETLRSVEQLANVINDQDKVISSWARENKAYSYQSSERTDDNDTDMYVNPKNALMKRSIVTWRIHGHMGEDAYIRQYLTLWRPSMLNDEKNIFYNAKSGATYMRAILEGTPIPVWDGDVDINDRIDEGRYRDRGLPEDGSSLPMYRWDGSEVRKLEILTHHRDNGPDDRYTTGRYVPIGINEVCGAPVNIAELNVPYTVPNIMITFGSNGMKIPGARELKLDAFSNSRKIHAYTPEEEADDALGFLAATPTLLDEIVRFEHARGVVHFIGSKVYVSYARTGITTVNDKNMMNEYKELHEFLSNAADDVLRAARPLRHESHEPNLSIFLDAWDKQANKSAGRIMKLIFGIPIILFGLFFLISNIVVAIV